ncbi:hypothetical protein G5C66_13245 [Nocardioides sp. KC13]|uniref:Uncharacterized protein n=1 Tax=Nocardioides turkmenicus TaxID=2711220 RepID=A0A6M1R0D4_9ACTN|nr:hypothetical protein [Nocardioides sp. KC13]NGN93704.1 hypothetical protein [Nocardioides sp. KC13]
MTSTTALLETAFSPDLPGDPLPPGPHANRWPGEPVEIGGAAATAVHRLWRARGHHPRPDGTPTTVPRRAVPSAGGCYPVQWHLVVPPGRGAHLGPGRYVYHPVAERLVRRPEPPGSAGSGRDDVEIVLTVQPGRTFGRYRHRSWPLWVADAAYALEALLLLLPGAHLPRDWSDLAAARHALGLPRAGQAVWWLDRGLVPEIAMARISLPLAPRLDEIAAAAICSRRSPALDRFQEHRARGRADAEVAEVARQSGQSWVLGADRVIAWDRPLRLDATGYARLWQVHREAARHTYSLNARGHGVRPVSGFCVPSAGAPPLVHAIAILENGASA